MTDKNFTAQTNKTSTSGGIGRATRTNFEYLVATLSKRTKGKKYENFVINYIWNSLADETLKPVTQQYVNRRMVHWGTGLVDTQRESFVSENANHALIDLYFPALRLGVECDEGQHVAQLEEDRTRTLDIARVISDYEELRVRVQLDVEGNAIAPGAVIDQIDDVVCRIRERKAEVESGRFDWAPQGFIPWRSDQPDWKLARDAGVLRASDAYVFQHNGEVKELFGRGDGTGTRLNNYKTNFDPRVHGYLVWCPTLAKKNAGGSYRSTNNSGILNRIFPEGSDVMIGEAVPNEESGRARDVAREEGEGPLPSWDYTLADTEARVRREMEDWKAPSVSESNSNGWSNARRITFVRTTDAVGRRGFQFLGVFGPPIGYREVDGVSFEVCRLESDVIKLPDMSAGG